ncbi:phage terminase large subunit [Helicobacter cholecystus]|uniref:phage terminase large subunit n=1 Tax=Helicobacter cholecystus TaxID=45498 RepID=UPI002739AC02|nr:phage terminase large subunit [Helicobacter cholecystus]
MDNLKELKSFLKALPALNDKDKEKRVKKAKESFRFFAQTYLPHHISPTETSLFRNFIYEHLEKLTLEHNKILIEAYRGGAKTTLITRLYSLWKLLKGDKRYLIIISSTLDLAKESIELLSLEIQDNVRLKNDFSLTPFGTRTSEEMSFCVSGTPCKIKAFGSGKKLRGTNFLSIRPDLIICDDIENDENVVSSTQREKLYAWFNKAVLKLPARTNPTYNIIIVGTTLHYDSLLKRIERRSDFYFKAFPLVINFPSNLDELNKENLPTFTPKDLILDDPSIKVSDVLSDYLEDRSSFMSEFQNQPLDKQNAPLSFFSTYEILPCQIDCIYIGIDPSLGKARSDYFALSFLHYSKTLKQFFWEAYGFKVSPDAMIDKIIDFTSKKLKLCKKILIACESVAFQEFFKDSLKKAFYEKNLILPIIGIKSTAHKEVRLDALSPLLKSQTFLIDKKSTLLLEELETYPKCAHDDLLDSGDIAYQAFLNSSVADYKNAKIPSTLLGRFQSIKERYS